MLAKYDTIGINYSNLRKTDSRIAAMIHNALGCAKTVLNVGAGTGSYEPHGIDVTAIEPSAEMITQRPKNAAPAIQASAEDLPFDDNSFDAVMATLTVHHWTDQAKGMAEMRRVTNGKIVILTYDPAFRNFWLLDYFPQLAALDDETMPALEMYKQWLGPVDIQPVPIPHDCTDGFVAAYWRRPAAYLDERIRKAMSPFWLIGDISAELNRLEDDLASGEWAKQYGDVMQQDAKDCGYRLVMTK